MSDATITTSIEAEQLSAFRDDALQIDHEDDYRAFYAPFDWINDEADIVLVGVTPGKQQAVEALQSLRKALLAGKNFDEAAHLAKEAASFKGTIRTLGARLMDHFRLNHVFGLRSTIELFGSENGRAHYTSVLRYPVLRNSRITAAIGAL